MFCCPNYYNFLLILYLVKTKMQTLNGYENIEENEAFAHCKCYIFHNVLKDNVL